MKKKKGLSIFEKFTFCKDDYKESLETQQSGTLNHHHHHQHHQHHRQHQLHQCHDCQSVNDIDSYPSYSPTVYHDIGDQKGKQRNTLIIRKSNKSAQQLLEFANEQQQQQQQVGEHGKTDIKNEKNHLKRSRDDMLDEIPIIEFSGSTDGQYGSESQEMEESDVEIQCDDPLPSRSMIENAIQHNESFPEQIEPDMKRQKTNNTTHRAEIKTGMVKDSKEKNTIESKIMYSTTGNTRVKKIDDRSIHKLCSGQVITSLSSAAKELIENSLDAGARTIEIRFKDMGMESLEVIDDGCGIEKHNYDLITGKNCTSKLNQFEDLENVSSYGFRGEALSSLCVLSDLSIFTRTSSDSSGSILEFQKKNRNLTISKQSSPRTVGTTVTIKNLFKSIPVRRIELKNNIKREYNKCISIIQAYALICSGVRFIVTNASGHQNNNKKQNVLISTGKAMKDNILTLFGSKQLKKMKEITHLKQNVGDEEDCQMKLYGFVSNPEIPSSGRSTNDRQYLFLNHRPIDLPKLERAVNEIYRMYSFHHYPVYILNLTLDTRFYDVNVSPDKRQIFLKNEESVVTFVKDCIIDLWEKSQRTFKLNEVSPMKQHHSALLSQFSQRKIEQYEVKQENCYTQIKEDTPFLSSSLDTRNEFDSENYETTKIKEETKETEVAVQSSIQSPDKRKRVSMIYKQSCISSQEKESTFREQIEAIKKKETSQSNEDEVKFIVTDEVKPYHNSIPVNEIKKNSQQSGDTVKGDMKNSEEEKQSISNNSQGNFTSTISQQNQQSITYNVLNTEEIVKQYRNYKEQKNKNISRINKIIEELNEYKLRRDSLEIATRFTPKKKKANKLKQEQSLNPEDVFNDHESDCSVVEMKRVIAKKDFQDMKVLGQFNLGFIIARLDNDLFILDQHASDEKYNYEQLKKNTKMNTQRLIRPREMQLSATEENVIMDHLDLFEKNGFLFDVAQNEAPSNRLKLLTIPFSKDTLFSEDDIYDIIHILRNGNNGGDLSKIQAPKISRMLASRACRKSVMIGKPLDHDKMQRIVSNLTKLEHPWCCPHGRPTMRHLCNLNQLRMESMFQYFETYKKGQIGVDYASRGLQYLSQYCTKTFE